jgi:predicted Zn-dependent protease
MAALHRLPLLLAAALTFAVPLAGCAYNAELGRQQLLIVDDAGLAQASDRAWANTLKTGYVSSDARKNARVRAVGQRVITAAGLGDRPWDYVVFLDEAPNAFVMPGGHVGVTVGLLDLVDNDDQLAAVIGHEAGHVVAHHAAERYSQQSTSKLLLGVAGAAAGSSSEFGPGTQRLWRRRQPVPVPAAVLAQAGAGGRPPGRRFHAAGRLQAARGRDPVAQDGSPGRQGSGKPEIASTHPSDASRIAALQAYISSKGW